MGAMDGQEDRRAEGLRSLVRRAFLSRQGPFTPGRGALAALTVGVPMLAGAIGGDTRAGFLVGFGALQGVLLDGAYPYRRRTIVHAIGAIGAAAALTLGTVAGAQPVAAVLFLAVLTGVTAFSGAFGARYDPLGLIIPVAALFGTAVPGTVTFALHQGGWMLLGGAWSTAVCLLGWAWRDDRSVDEAAAAVLDAAAAVVEHVASEPPTTPGAPGPPGTPTAPVPAPRELRVRLDELTDATTAAYGPSGPAGRRYRLFGLGADRLAVRAAALTETVTAVSVARGSLPAPLRQVLRAWSAAAAAALRAVVEPSGSPGARAGAAAAEARRAAALDDVGAAVEGLATHALPGPDAVATAADLGVVLRAVDRLDDAISSTIASLSEDRPLPLLVAGEPGTGRWSRLLGALSPHLARRDPRCRLAIRLAVMVAIGETVVQAAAIDHGIWLVLTVLVILRTDRSSTWTRAVQRVVGTVAGSVLAAVLLELLGGDRQPIGSHLIVLILVLMTLVAVALPLITVNYGYFVVLLTPLALILADLSGPSTWRTAATRAVLTIGGGALALVADAVVLPVREGHRLPAQMAALVRHTGRYLDAVLESHEHGDPDRPRITADRRRAQHVAASAIDTTARLHGSTRADRRSAAAAAPVLEACLELMSSVRAAAVDTLGSALCVNPIPDELPLRAAVGALRSSTAEGFSMLAARIERVDLEHARLAAPVVREALVRPLPGLDGLEAGVEQLYSSRRAEIASGAELGAPPTPRQDAVERWHDLLRFLQRVQDRMGRAELAVDRLGGAVLSIADA